MIERKANGYSFSIPIHVPMDGSRRNPFSYGFENHRPTVPIRTPYEDFEANPTSNQCRCSDCYQRKQRQRDSILRQQRRYNRDNNRSIGVFREIPIVIENQKKDATPGFDAPKNISSKKEQRKVNENAQVDDVKKVPSSSDEYSVTESARGQKCNIQGNPEMKTASTSNEEAEEIDVEELKQKKLGKIAEISAEVEKLSERVTAFQEKEKCKEYLYLEEMLMKCLLRLDEISTDGITDVRTSRKKVASTASEWLKRLEDKLEDESESQMMETPESAESAETEGTSSCKEESKEKDIGERAEIRESELNGANEFNKVESEPSSDVISCEILEETSNCKADSEEKDIGETFEVRESELVDASEFNKIYSKPGSDVISCELIEDQGIADMSCDEDTEQSDMLEEVDLDNDSSKNTEKLVEDKEELEKLVVDEICSPKVLKC